MLFPQFHTCVITENVVSFPRSELDVACDDPRCPPDSVVTLYFATDAKRQDGPVPAPTPAVPHASAHHDPILHWDSYTNLEMSDDGELSSHPVLAGLVIPRLCQGWWLVVGYDEGISRSRLVD